MKNKETVRAGYNAIANAYLATRKPDSEDVRLLDELVQRLPRGARVLDAGCGAGVPVAQYLSRYFDVVGVDFAEAQLQLARQLVPQAQFVCQDLTELSFPDATIDAICSYYAIIHIPRKEHEAILNDFYRLLKPSGLALLCLGADDLEDDIVEDYLGARMYWSHYDAETNLGMIKACGFELIWSKIVADATSPGSGHLFVLIQKKPA
ncbi:MAG: methyltransferase type 11 [candidate division Zixibacteria bacterium HGW-Zixibacteria-1]|nr:MAG: methyltransferase type 11 [candidate division Zixibacteria bacterium HGW-Zixibacteria-1]